MKAKANPFRTLLLVLPVVLVAAAVALFGVGLRTAETQTTTPKMKVHDLGTLGGGSSHATGINDSGQVVGWSSTNNGTQHAFLYDAGAVTPKMQDLGTLGGIDSRAMSINDAGKVVGYSTTSAGERHAFLYDSTNGMQDLNSLIPADSGWTVSEATAISSDGKIAATGHKDGVGTHALLLTPTSDSPPPADTEAPSAPTITSPQNNSYDTDGSFSVSGSAEAGSTVKLFEGATSKGTTKADSSSGAWSIALSGVSEGAHTYFAKATDTAGNTSTASNSVTITVDTRAPKADSVVPKEDATGVAPGANVKATFSEAMRASSINTNTFQLFRAGTTTAIAAVVSYDAGTKTATLNPDANLRRGTKYKAVVSTGARDLAGNQLDQDATLSGNQPEEWFFTIRR
jgi:probable HAF family extracellular repeat protein